MSGRLLVADAVRSRGELRGDSVLIDSGRVVAVGDRIAGTADIPISRYAGTIVPGLRDAHFHPVGYAASLARTNLKDASSFSEIQARLRAAAERAETGAALTALRLDDESLQEGRLPDRHVLDAAVPDRPVMLVRYCGHVFVANTAALEAAGITRDTPDPIGGSLDRDQSGVPTGILRETAGQMVSNAIEHLAPGVTHDELLSALHGLPGLGITGIGAIVSVDGGLWCGADAELDTLLAVSARSPVALRVLVIAPSPDALEQAAERIAATSGPIEFLGVKMFSDGSLGGHTAAMHQPFADAPAELGTLRLPADAHALATRSLQLGGRVAIHAIGDRANTGVLDLMEVLVHDGADPSDLRIEHASVLTDDDISRFGELGITASVQPAFLASETGWLERRVGPGRMLTTYAFRSLAEAGVPLAGGSDCPVEPPHPLWGMAAARDRCGLVPGEGLDPIAALELFTTGAAAAINEMGTIEPGSPADLTVIADDPVTSPPDALRRSSVVGTWVGGHEAAMTGDPTWLA